MPADVYRGSTLGRALAASLDELIASQNIPASMREQIMRMYDASMCEQLKDSRLQVQGKADQLHGRIEDGKLETYNNYNGNWTFDLKQARMKGRAFNSAPSSGYANRDGRVIQNVQVVAVDCKQAELEQAPIEEAPLEVAASGEADDGNAAATTADDEVDDALLQYDGASDPAEPPAAPAAPAAACAARAEPPATHAAAPRAARLPQMDGEDDDGDDGDDWALPEDDADPLQDLPGGSRPRGSSSALTAGGEGDSGEELNSDDDSDDDVRRGGAQATYTNTVHAQFRKVKRQRNKWNCELTAGVATIDGLDYVFTKCDATWVF